MKKFLKLQFVLALAVGFTFASCGDDDDDDMEPEPTTIYADLGGSTMVDDPANPGTMIEQGTLSLRSVVDTAIGIIASGNTGLNEYFAPLFAEVGDGDLSGVTALSASLTNFFCANVGGPCTYNGLDMAAAHDPAQNSRMGKKSNDADYDEFVGIVVDAAGRNGVDITTPAPVVGKLAEVLESLREPIVQE